LRRRQACLGQRAALVGRGLHHVRHRVQVPLEALAVRRVHVARFFQGDQVIHIEQVRPRRSHVGQQVGRVAADVQLGQALGSVNGGAYLSFVGQRKFGVHGRRDQRGRCIAGADHVGPSLHLGQRKVNH
jgi:hypothetical protein